MTATSSSHLAAGPDSALIAAGWANPSVPGTYQRSHSSLLTGAFGSSLPATTAWE